MRPDRPRGLLPREGRLDPRGQAHLHRLRGPRRVPGVRARARRAVRHLGRVVRARAAAPQAPRRLTSDDRAALAASVRRVDLVDVTAQELGRQVDHDHEHEVGAVFGVHRAGLDRAPVDHDHRARGSPAVPHGTAARAGPPDRARRWNRRRRLIGSCARRHVLDGELEAGQLRRPVLLDLVDGVQHQIVEGSPRVRCSGTSAGASWPRSAAAAAVRRRRFGAALRRRSWRVWWRSVRTGQPYADVGALGGGADEAGIVHQPVGRRVEQPFVRGGTESLEGGRRRLCQPHDGAAQR